MTPNCVMANQDSITTHYKIIFCHQIKIKVISYGTAENIGIEQDT